MTHLAPSVDGGGTDVVDVVVAAVATVVSSLGISSSGGLFYVRIVV
jgi:hypothetical protein